MMLKQFQKNYNQVFSKILEMLFVDLLQLYLSFHSEGKFPFRV